MMTFNATQKSRIQILLFILHFTTLPGALNLTAQTTGNSTLNNYTHRIAGAIPEPRLLIMTLSVGSG